MKLGTCVRTSWHRRAQHTVNGQQSQGVTDTPPGLWPSLRLLRDLWPLLLFSVSSPGNWGYDRIYLTSLLQKFGMCGPGTCVTQPMCTSAPVIICVQRECSAWTVSLHLPRSSCYPCFPDGARDSERLTSRPRLAQLVNSRAVMSIWYVERYQRPHPSHLPTHDQASSPASSCSALFSPVPWLP